MITLSKIAKEAHVSVSTASKAFSGSREVSEETRNLVFSVAKKYGCFKRFYSAKYSRYVVAVICPEFASIYYSTYLAFLRRYLEKEGCEICVAESSFSEEKEKELLDYYCQHAEVDAVILMNPQIESYDFREIPVLLIGKEMQESGFPAILCDISSALKESFEYLQEKGVKSVGFIGEEKTPGKRSAFCRLAAEYGVEAKEEHILLSKERFEKGGYRAMEELLATSRPPRSVICAYDNMAIGAIRCALDHGLRVPDDIAVMGMDDIPQAPYLVPPLASVTTQTKERCRLAVMTVISMINGTEVPSVQVFRSQFRLRESFEIR